MKTLAVDLVIGSTFMKARIEKVKNKEDGTLSMCVTVDPASVIQGKNYPAGTTIETIDSKKLFRA